MDFRFLLLLICFFVSGFAALLYQTAWTREFAFLFGTSELAVVAVLAAYMGGLALGAAAAARFVGRLRRPVLAYGVLELGIALCALAVPVGIRLVQGVYLAVAGGLDAPPESIGISTALFHLAGAFIVLVPCTALMGATLPLLARYAVHEEAQIGPRIGVLYAVNTFGAIAGTLTAAFFLLPAVGLRQTVYVGVAGNAVVFLAAALLARSIGPTAEANSASRPTERTGFHWILPAMTISGAVSFVYEVLWTRLLGQVLGGSTAAFASMLSSFLLGIALGSALAARFAKSRSSALVGFILAQIGTGVLAWIAFRAADRLPDLARAVGAHPAAPAPGAAAAGIVLLPVTLCIGATFPFAVRLLARDADDAARVSGRVYAWNTLGSILGAILAGFFLLPTFGFEKTATIGVATSLLLAVGAAGLSTPRRPRLAAAAGFALVLAVVVGLPMPERLLMNSAISGQRIMGDLFYLGVGRSATVTVVETQTGWRLLTNGLPESAVERPEYPDLRFNETAWLSLLPTAARPETDRMLIIGLGAGRTLESTASSVSEIDLIELEEEVVIANRRIPRPVDPLDDPRIQLRLGDARGALTLSKARYDAIVSQPSHPWTSGASHLYTREFFELVESKLEPDGVFIQWIGASFVDRNLFGSLMASMSDVFTYVHVYRPVRAALVFMASDEPIDLAESAPRALAQSPDDFGRQGLHRLEDFYASWTLDTEGVKGLGAGHPPNTDDHNRLSTRRLPPARGGIRMQDLDAAFAEYEPLTPARLSRVDALAVLARMDLLGDGARGAQLARARSSLEQSIFSGRRAISAGRRGIARRHFARAFELDPTDPRAFAGLIEVGESSLLDLDTLGSLERSVLAARDARAAGDYEGVQAQDAQLGAVSPGDPLFAQIVGLRASWRIRSGDPERAREAREIIEILLTRERTSLHYLWRAKAAAVADERDTAWATLETVVGQRRLSRAVAVEALALAKSLGNPPGRYSNVTARLENSLSAKR